MIASPSENEVQSFHEVQSQGLLRYVRSTTTNDEEMSKMQHFEAVETIYSSNDRTFSGRRHKHITNWKKG
jgi:hypothetical protein